MCKKISIPLSAEGNKLSFCCLSVTAADAMSLVVLTAEMADGSISDFAASWNVTRDFVWACGPAVLRRVSVGTVTLTWWVRARRVCCTEGFVPTTALSLRNWTAVSRTAVDDVRSKTSADDWLLCADVSAIAGRGVWPSEKSRQGWLLHADPSPVTYLAVL